MEFLSELHPKVVHFSISFFVLYFIFETSGVLLKKDYLVKSAFIILILGLVSSLLSVLTGNQAYETAKLLFINDPDFYNYLISRHELFATISLWYFTAIFFIRTYLIIKKKFIRNYQFVFIILSLIGVIIILFTSYYGGELVFKYGIGTNLFGK